MADTNIKIHPDLEPFQPSTANLFDANKAAHLLNRAGFGGTPEEIEKFQKLGPAAAVEELLGFENKTAEEQNPKDLPDLSPIKDYPDNFRMLQVVEQMGFADAPRAQD